MFSVRLSLKVKQKISKVFKKKYTIFPQFFSLGRIRSQVTVAKSWSRIRIILIQAHSTVPV